MRFSIVFDENGTFLAASEGGEDLPEAELHQTVERLLVDLDASELTQSPQRGEADDNESD